MAQEQADPIQQALGYLRYQGAKPFEAIDALLARTAEDWARALDGVSEEQAGYRPAEGEWCIKEAVAHCAYTDRSVNQDVARMAGVPPVTGEVQQVRALGLVPEDLAALPIEDLRRELAALYEETRALARRLAEGGKLEASAPHPLFGALNAKEWLAFHRVHAIDHIRQVEAIKASPGYPGA
jgi:hypothetical protein